MRFAFALLLLAGLAACGHGLSGGYVPPPTGANVAPIIVDGGPPSIAIGNINLPFVSVTVCLPGTATCQLVDHVLVDTASTGLRIIASVLPATLNFPQAVDTAGAPLWECLQFVDGYSWGSVRRADVQIANGTASDQSIQLIGDPGNTLAPADCSGNGTLLAENTVDSFGANGVLGLNVFQHDCGTICADPANLIAAAYYGCPTGGSCANSAAALSAQVQNPVYNLPADNNGVAITMSAIGANGQLTAAGSLILGIDTHSNNMLGSAAVLSVDPVLGYFTTTYNGVSLPDSFIDSGSNALFFNDSALTVCTTQSGFYCPAQLQTLQASNQQAGGPLNAVSFKVDNLETLSTTNPSYNALPSIAGSNPLTLSFDWGLPFFYGRTVFVGFEGRSASQNAGPFFAY